MQLLHLTLPSAAENVALDEALLDEAEAGAADEGEVLRFWESPEHVVVLGRSSQLAEEVCLAACGSMPVVRRCSGGTAVVGGPGCLMYALVLSYVRHPLLRVIEQAHRYVLERLAAAIRPQLPDVRLAGTSDLAVGDRKISGNSLRCKRSHVLYHGTLLYNFPLELISRCLGQAPRQPEYRRGREHADFVANAAVEPAAVQRNLAELWSVQEMCGEWPQARLQRLVAERYGRAEWNQRR
jgi:lipoate-protein ligase A